MSFLVRLLFLIGPVSAAGELSNPQNFDVNTKLEDVLVVPEKTPIEISALPTDSIYIKDRILKARLQNLKTYIVGQKPGLTLMKVASKEIRVRILSELDWQSHKDFYKIFGDHPSLKIDYSQLQPIVVGELLLESDWIQLLQWLGNRKTKVKFEVEFLNPALKELALNTLSKQLGFEVKDVDSSLNLKSARLLDKDDLKKLDSLSLEPQLENSNGQQLGMLDIQFVSVTDSELKNATPILPSSFQWSLGEKIQWLSQIIESDYSQLNALNNKSSLIHLMLFENEKTNYHSGGEFAIQQRSIYRNDVQWKTYGMFVEAIAKSLTKDEVQVSLKIQMSHLISSDMNQPSLSQDSWSQNFRVKIGKPLIVSNSLTNMFAKNRNNHLFLKSIPILGDLFKGKNSNKENSNIYMVIKIN